MPTDTFYRLPEEKQLRLKNAIIEELSRVPFTEISINRIVQTAGIARGSYYQYFTAKEDMLSYILHEYKSCLRSAVEECHEKIGNDLSQLVKTIFLTAVNYATAEETSVVFRNIFPSLRLSDILAEFNPNFKHMPEFNQNRLKNEILLAVFKDSLARVVTNPAAVEKTKQDFEKKINLIQSLPEV